MQESSLKTLFHPFESGLLNVPEQGNRVLFFNAPASMQLPDGFAAELSLVQDSRPVFQALEAQGFSVAPQAVGEGFDLVLVLAGRFRGQNELWIAQALKRAKPGGRVVIAGGKTDGAASLKKRIAGLLDIEGHASKNHGVVFWLVRDERAADVAAALEAENPQLTLEGGFVTHPGMFSHDRTDAGSKLLIENLPANLSGAAADFGAGWGYLSAHLARMSDKITSISLYEAGFGACEAARRNMAALAPDMEANVIWCDLLAEKIGRRYDVIVMNPPFHQSRAAEPSIGEGMIRAASLALKPGGRLFLVANRPLPYEPVLAAGFARSGEVCRDERYKVLWAVR